MSGLSLRLTPPDGPVRPLLEAWLWRAAASWCVPVVDVTEGVAASAIAGETEGDPATTYAGPSVIPALLGASGPRRAWCTWAVALPDRHGALVRAPYLRLGGRPLGTLAVDGDGLTLRFGPAAPLWAPPDAPEPWVEAARRARAELADAVAALPGVHAEVRDDGASGAAAALAEALGVAPPRREAATPSPVPGPCVACRHANQGTFDLSFDGVLACRFAGGRPIDAVCEVEVEGGFAYEPWDGVNGTWFGPGPDR